MRHILLFLVIYLLIFASCHKESGYKPLAKPPIVDTNSVVSEPKRPIPLDSLKGKWTTVYDTSQVYFELVNYCANFVGSELKMVRYHFRDYSFQCGSTITFEKLDYMKGTVSLDSTQFSYTGFYSDTAFINPNADSCRFMGNFAFNGSLYTVKDTLFLEWNAEPEITNRIFKFLRK